MSRVLLSREAMALGQRLVDQLAGLPAATVLDALAAVVYATIATCTRSGGPAVGRGLVARFLRIAALDEAAAAQPQPEEPAS